VSKTRLEAFSDGVVAILITIMVLELKTPHGIEWHALFEREFAVGLLSYLLSFIYIAIYWNNHHHMLHACSRVNGTILWANTHLLFWLSLIPFTTRWMAETAMEAHLQRLPTATYGFVMFMAGNAFNLLQVALIRQHGRESTLARATGADWKGKLSGVLNGLAIPLALVWPRLAIAVYTGVGLMWLVPDRRVERLMVD
jgi:uncharacterized membrane protein